MRLWVHEENSRAEKLYLKLGFVRTGKSLPDPKAPETLEYEMVLARP
ncbi:hypothetical protein NKH77_29280 [Streptomyces sp. M19]